MIKLLNIYVHFNILFHELFNSIIRFLKQAKLFSNEEPEYIFPPNNDKKEPPFMIIFWGTTRLSCCNRDKSLFVNAKGQA